MFVFITFLSLRCSFIILWTKIKQGVLSVIWLILSVPLTSFMVSMCCLEMLLRLCYILQIWCFHYHLFMSFPTHCVSRKNDNFYYDNLLCRFPVTNTLNRKITMSFTVHQHFFCLTVYLYKPCNCTGTLWHCLQLQNVPHPQNIILTYWYMCQQSI